MSALIRKVKGKAGETLVETLFAILIFSFASITMYSMVTSALTINEKAKAADLANQSQMIVAERAEGEGKSTSVSLVLTDTPEGTGNQSMGQLKVNIFGGENGELYAYYIDDSVSSEGGNG